VRFISIADSGIRIVEFGIRSERACWRARVGISKKNVERKFQVPKSRSFKLQFQGSAQSSGSLRIEELECDHSLDFGAWILEPENLIQLRLIAPVNNLTVQTRGP
jgi:hypothetical protein